MNGKSFFHASCHQYGRMGYEQQRRAIVVANSESEALGLLLMEYDDTDACEWDLKQIADGSPLVIQVCDIEHN